MLSGIPKPPQADEKKVFSLCFCKIGVRTAKLVCSERSFFSPLNLPDDPRSASLSGDSSQPFSYSLVDYSLWRLSAISRYALSLPPRSLAVLLHGRACLVWWLGKLQMWFEEHPSPAARAFPWKWRVYSPGACGSEVLSPYLSHESSTLPSPHRLIWQTLWARSSEQLIMVQRVFYLELVMGVRRTERTRTPDSPSPLTAEKMLTDRASVCLCVKQSKQVSSQVCPCMYNCRCADISRFGVCQQEWKHTPRSWQCNAAAKQALVLSHRCLFPSPRQPVQMTPGPGDRSSMSTAPVDTWKTIPTITALFSHSERLCPLYFLPYSHRIVIFLTSSVSLIPLPSSVLYSPITSFFIHPSFLPCLLNLPCPVIHCRYDIPSRSVQQSR